MFGLPQHRAVPGLWQPGTALGDSLYSVCTAFQVRNERGSAAAEWIIIALIALEIVVSAGLCERVADDDALYMLV